MSDDAVIRDLQTSLDRVTEDRDKVREFAREMARLMKLHGLDYYEVHINFAKEYAYEASE